MEYAKSGGFRAFMRHKSGSFIGGVLAVVLGSSVWANADVEKNIANPKNWAMQAGDMANQRYSRLNQVNKGNVDKLRVAWTFSTGVLRGHEGSPLVVDGVMYLHSPFPNKVFAVDIDTQKILWKYEPKQDAAVIAQMCCDTVNRGVAYAENKVILQQADSTMVALVWGPLATYFAKRVKSPVLRVVVMRSEPGLTLEFDMAMGVRHGEAAWKAQIDALLKTHQAQILALLKSFDVPVLELPHANPAQH